MAEPILNCSRVMAGIGQGVAAGVAQHVDVNFEREACALANALDQSIGGIRCERAVTLGGKDVTRVRKLPLELAQCPDFVSTQRVNAREFRDVRVDQPKKKN